MTEMEKLILLLADAEIPFEITKNPVGNDQVWYPSREMPMCDVICNEYSYGGNLGLLEIMGLVPADCGDDVQGYLTALEVFIRIAEDHLKPEE